jgi:hypothetical protein
MFVLVNMSGDKGALELANALNSNKSLTSLDLSRTFPFRFLPPSLSLSCFPCT